jgi:hypothetical protein
MRIGSVTITLRRPSTRAQLQPTHSTYVICPLSKWRRILSHQERNEGETL